MRSLIISLVVVYLAVVCHGTRPLNLRVNAPVDDSFISKITLLDQDSLTFVEDRVASQLKISHEEAEHLRLSFLQWVSLNFLVNSTSAATTEGPFVPTLQVDEFWHNFILYTRKYQAWCLKHFGHFIHHVPDEETIEAAGSQHNSDWTKTVALMKDIYGVNWGNHLRTVHVAIAILSGQQLDAEDAQRQLDALEQLQVDS